MADKKQDRLKKVMQMFRVECTEHLETINKVLLDVERGLPENERLERLQAAGRSAHNIKGSARMVGLNDIEVLAHATESVLQAAMKNGLELDANICDLLYDALDAIDNLTSGQEVNTQVIQESLYALVTPSESTESVPVENDAVEDSTNVPPPDPVETPESDTETEPSLSEDDNKTRKFDLPANSQTIRVELDKLDNLIAQIGELQVSRMNADMHINTLRDVTRMAEKFSYNWDEMNAVIQHIMRGNQRSYLHTMIENQTAQLQGLVKTLQGVVQSMSSDTIRLGIVTDDLRDRVRSIRMLPFKVISLGFERVVRDAAVAEQKQVNFQVIGADVELDKSVLDVLKDPLMHLLTNAVSHGIETAEQRQRLGKPEAGQVKLSIQQHGSEVSISVSDDGSGFDLEALQSQVGTTAKSDKTRSEDVIQLAFRPGVSTAKTVSTISGRGIGLDVVRTKLEAIHGRIRVQSTSEQGTTIELLVPTSLAITHALLVRVNQQQFAIPMSSIEKIVEVNNILDVNGQNVIQLDGTHIPLVSLASILGMPQQAFDTTRINRAVVFNAGDYRIAALVTDVMIEQELSVKPMGNLLKAVPYVVGAAMLGNGLPIIVLNPADILRTATHGGRSAIRIEHTNNDEDESSEPEFHILVVDDSITTRTLEQNILEAAGYLVTTAINGVEALKQLERAEFDLVISDVQMPEMDGLQLTRKIRELKRFQHLPIILVTSLESREDRESGMSAGANSYIVKKNFSQREFINLIEDYIEK